MTSDETRRRDRFASELRDKGRNEIKDLQRKYGLKPTGTISNKLLDVLAAVETGASQKTVEQLQSKYESAVRKGYFGVESTLPGDVLRSIEKRQALSPEQIGRLNKTQAEFLGYKTEQLGNRQVVVQVQKPVPQVVPGGVTSGGVTSYVDLGRQRLPVSESPIAKQERVEKELRMSIRPEYVPSEIKGGVIKRGYIAPVAQRTVPIPREEPLKPGKVGLIPITTQLKEPYVPQKIVVSEGRPFSIEFGPGGIQRAAVGEQRAAVGKRMEIIRKFEERFVNVLKPSVRGENVLRSFTPIKRSAPLIAEVAGFVTAGPKLVTSWPVLSPLEKGKQVVMTTAAFSGKAGLLGKGLGLFELGKLGVKTVSTGYRPGTIGELAFYGVAFKGAERGVRGGVGFATRFGKVVVQEVKLARAGVEYRDVIVRPSMIPALRERGISRELRVQPVESFVGGGQVVADVAGFKSGEVLRFKLGKSELMLPENIRVPEFVNVAGRGKKVEYVGERVGPEPLVDVPKTETFYRQQTRVGKPWITPFYKTEVRSSALGYYEQNIPAIFMRTGPQLFEGLRSGKLTVGDVGYSLFKKDIIKAHETSHYLDNLLVEKKPVTRYLSYPSKSFVSYSEYQLIASKFNRLVGKKELPINLEKYGYDYYQVPSEINARLTGAYVEYPRLFEKVSPEIAAKIRSRTSLLDEGLGAGEVKSERVRFERTRFGPGNEVMIPEFAVGRSRGVVSEYEFGVGKIGRTEGFVGMLGKGVAKGDVIEFRRAETGASSYLGNQVFAGRTIVSGKVSPFELPRFSNARDLAVRPGRAGPSGPQFPSGGKSLLEFTSNRVGYKPLKQLFQESESMDYYLARQYPRDVIKVGTVERLLVFKGFKLQTPIEVFRSAFRKEQFGSGYGKPSVTKIGGSFVDLSKPKVSKPKGSSAGGGASVLFTKLKKPSRVFTEQASRVVGVGVASSVGTASFRKSVYGSKAGQERGGGQRVLYGQKYSYDFPKERARSVNSLRNIGGFVFRLKNGQVVGRVQGVGVGQGRVQKPVVRFADLVVPRTKVGQDVYPVVDVGVKQDVAQRYNYSYVPESISRYKYGFRFGVEEPPSKKRMFFTSEKASERNESLYNVFVRRVGRWVKVNVYPLPKGKALALGRRVVESGAGRSFKIVKVGSTRPELLSFGDVGFRYRPAKRDAGVFVQKSKFSISSIGELKEITFKGLRKLREMRGGFSKIVKFK